MNAFKNTDTLGSMLQFHFPWILNIFIHKEFPFLRIYVILNLVPLWSHKGSFGFLLTEFFWGYKSYEVPVVKVLGSFITQKEC